MHDGIANVRFLGSISAGFPSPADDYRENRLDLNELVAPHPHTVYYMRVTGDSMVGACIHNGDVEDEFLVDSSQVQRDFPIRLEENPT